jgi:hypothetical protein
MTGIYRILAALVSHYHPAISITVCLDPLPMQKLIQESFQNNWKRCSAEKTWKK